MHVHNNITWSVLEDLQLNSLEFEMKWGDMKGFFCDIWSVAHSDMQVTAWYFSHQVINKYIWISPKHAIFQITSLKISLTWQVIMLHVEYIFNHYVLYCHSILVPCFNWKLASTCHTSTLRLCKVKDSITTHVSHMKRKFWVYLWKCSCASGAQFKKPNHCNLEVNQEKMSSAKHTREWERRVNDGFWNKSRLFG